MISSVRIRNFGPILDLELELGALNVLIGPNASGKTAILEAIRTMCSAADERRPPLGTGRDGEHTELSMKATLPVSGTRVEWTVTSDTSQPWRTLAPLEPGNSLDQEARREFRNAAIYRHLEGEGRTGMSTPRDREEARIITWHDTPEGERLSPACDRAAATVAALRHGGIVLLDNPDAGLHPGAVEALAHFILDRTQDLVYVRRSRGGRDHRDPGEETGDPQERDGTRRAHPGRVPRNQGVRSMTEQQKPLETSRRMLELADRAHREIRKGDWEEDLDHALQTAALLRRLARTAEQIAERAETESRGFPNLTVERLMTITQDLDPNMCVVLQDGSVPTAHLISAREYHAHAALPVWGRTSTTLGELRWTLRKSVGTGRRSHQGEEYRVRDRTPLWIFRTDQEGREALTGAKQEGEQLTLMTETLPSAHPEEAG